MTPEQEPSPEAFENLFVNNRELNKLATYLNRFNPIKVMGMERMEIRHSKILAWLLNPYENHGLGDQFLRAFLCEARRGYSSSPTSLEILQADLRDAEIRREWKHIDIFILLPHLDWAFIVENKYHSTQHGEQLKRYANQIETLYNIEPCGIFLTLHDEAPEDERYAPIQYDSICGILAELIERKADTIKLEAAVFIKHYLKVIEEATGMNKDKKDMAVLAAQLYREHQKVLDFIWEHCETTGFHLAEKEIIGTNPKYGTLFKVEGQEFQFLWDDSGCDEFVPKKWFDALDGMEVAWKEVEGKWFPLFCWFEEGNKEIYLSAGIGELNDDELRKSIIKGIKGLTEKNNEVIQTPEEQDYGNFLKNNQEPINDMLNSEEIATAMRNLLKKFAPAFAAVATVLSEISP